MKKSLTIVATLMLFEISCVFFLFSLIYLILIVGFIGYGRDGYFPVETKISATIISSIFLVISGYGIFRSIKLFKKREMLISKPKIFLLFIFSIILTLLLCYLSGIRIIIH